MIDAEYFVKRWAQYGFRVYAGVPCSFLKPFINYVIDSPDLRYIGAANEGDAVAIAAGAELGGYRGVAMCQNSGLGNAVNPLTSLTFAFRIPVLLIVTLRGEPDGPADEPQHELMGKITTDLLELMRIPWEYFPTSEEAVEPALLNAVRYLDSERRPFALVMRKGSIRPTDLSPTREARPCSPTIGEKLKPSATRREMLMAIQASTSLDDVIIASTGYTGRELYACGDRPGQLYMVGSMGCASSLGLGLAIARPDRRVIILDGDGAALMRLGAMCTLGYERPANVVHVVLDNGMHESTGGQKTVSSSIDFCALSSASGYPRSVAVSSPDDLQNALESGDRELTFIHVPIRPGVTSDLPRPSITPSGVARRLREFLVRAG